MMYLHWIIASFFSRRLLCTNKLPTYGILLKYWISCLLRCDALSSGEWLPTFREIVVPSSSYSRSPRRSNIRYNDTSNQQDAAKFVFIDSFKLALHVSGDSFAHLQEHFDCIYSFLEPSTDSAVCCWPVTQIGWNRPPCDTCRQQTAEEPSNLCHRSAAESRVGTLFQKAVYTVKVLLNMGENVARNM